MAKRGPKGPSKYTTKFIEREAEALLKYAETCPLIPFEKEFAFRRGYPSQRMSEFAQASEKFSVALKKMKDIQEYKLVIGALAGKLNSTMAIFTLKNVAGWRNEQYLEHKGAGLTLTQIVQMLNGNDNDKQAKSKTREKFDGELL